MKWVVFILVFFVLAVIVRYEHIHQYEIPESTTATDDIDTLRNPAASPTVLDSASADPAAITLLADIPYGPEPRMVFDVYTLPDGESAKPLIIMVHGGAWALGDKRNENSITNKVDYWVPRGYVVASINYPLLPIPPDEQARAVARAIAYIQANTHTLGADAGDITVMGHSAGAHLVALVSSTQHQYPELAPWRRSIVIDTEALDVVSVMEDVPARLFTNAFGTDPAYWATTSPLAQLSTTTEPMLVVCSSFRAGVCDIAGAYQAKAAEYGADVSILRELRTHAETNKELGLDNSYTEAVDAFLQQY